MKLQVFAIYDSAVSDFNNPFYLHAEGEARRGFIEVCKNPETKLNKYPSDYTLFHLGSYISDSATFDLFPAPVRVLGALEAINM